MCVVVIAAEVLVARGERAGSVVASVVIDVEAAKIVEGEEWGGGDGGGGRSCSRSSERRRCNFSTGLAGSGSSLFGQTIERE